MHLFPKFFESLIFLPKMFLPPVGLLSDQDAFPDDLATIQQIVDRLTLLVCLHSMIYAHFFEFLLKVSSFFLKNLLLMFPKPFESPLKFLIVFFQ